MSKAKFDYEGKDLEAMAFAANYSRWILEIFEPYLGKRIVEVGAGKGSFTKLILELSPKKLILIEPSKNMYGLLEQEVKKLPHKEKVFTFNGFLSDSAKSIQQVHSPDSAIYINVLEHVEDDGQELKTVYSMLPQGGRLFIFVPALQRLYSEYDKSIGHFRRYYKKDLEKMCQIAGFSILYSSYFDMPGILPWWTKYTVGKSTNMRTKDIEKYDKFAIPFIKRLEKKIKPPIGKNIILVAEKK